MTYPPGAEPGYRRTSLSAEEKARGEANFARFVAQMLVASGRLVRPGESRGPHVCELVPSLPDASAL